MQIPTAETVARLVHAVRGERVLFDAFTKQGEQFAVVFDAIKRLIAEDDARRARPKRRIGFMA